MQNQSHFYILTMTNPNRKLRKQSHLPPQQQRIKYLGIKLTKGVNDLYTKYQKTLLKEINGKKLCLWSGRLNTIKMPMLPRATYKSNSIPRKIPKLFFFRNRKEILKFIWKSQRTMNSYMILRKKNKSAGLTLWLQNTGNPP